jgi:hypothetical protein
MALVGDFVFITGKRRTKIVNLKVSRKYRLVLLEKPSLGKTKL